MGKCGSSWSQARLPLEIYFYFCNVINIKEENLDEYKEKLKELQANFKYRFDDLKSLKSTFPFL